MLFSEFQDILQELNTGATNPNYIGGILKLVLGKISRHKLPSRVKLANITTSGATSFNLNTLVTDFIDFKTQIGEGNKDRCIYFYQSSSLPFDLPLVNNSRFVDHTEGGYATLIGRTLKISLPSGMTVPANIYFPYYSKYLVLDDDGVTEKEKPENSNDTIISPSEFDDILIDGVLLYISRKEKEDSEYAKNVQEWEKRVQELVFLM